MSTHTPLYIQEQGRTINSLVVNQHNQNINQLHQNIQMRTHDLVLKQILASVGVNVTLHITNVPGIPSIANIYTTSAYS